MLKILILPPKFPQNEGFLVRNLCIFFKENFQSRGFSDAVNLWGGANNNNNNNK